MAGSPTVRGRRLAAELKRLRESHNLTIDQAADKAEISKSALSRIENAIVTPRPPVLRALISAYEVEDADAQALLTLARDAKQKGWWQAYGELQPLMISYIGLEAEAHSIQTYETIYIPGILQTHEYAVAISRAFYPNALDDEMNRRIAVRLKRQNRLSDLELTALIEETVLTRPVGGAETMREQLKHLIDVSHRPNVTIRVLLQNCGAHPGLDGPFSILSFPDDKDRNVGFVESAAGQTWLEPDDIARLSGTFQTLKKLSLSPEATHQYIESMLRNSE